MLIAVGQILSPEQFRQTDLKALQQRRILDPGFAGFDAQFDWRDHLRLEIPSERPEAHAIAATLDQLARTPEGQQLMRQASAMQAFRARTSAYPAHVNITLGAHNDFDMATGTLRMNIPLMQQHQFIGPDGRGVDFSLQHVLFHELLHAADGFNHPAHKQLLHDHVERLLAAEGLPATDGFEQFNFRLTMQGSLYFETPALAETNRFMGRYFCEPARRDAHSQPRYPAMDARSIPHYALGELAPGRCPATASQAAEPSPPVPRR